MAAPPLPPHWPRPMSRKDRDCNDRAFLPTPPLDACSRSGAACSHHWQSEACHKEAPFHDGNFHVCGVCSNCAHHTLIDAQANINVNDPEKDRFSWNNGVRFTPPAPGAGPNGFPWPAGTVGTWPGFLTRLCKSCTYTEQTKLLYLKNNDSDPAVRAYHRASKPNVPDFKRNTCTCRYELGGIEPSIAKFVNNVDFSEYNSPRECSRHKLQTWNDMVARRNANDDWLRHTARDVKGRLCMASGRRLRSRNSAKLKAYRACRCGADPDTPAHPYRPAPAATPGLPHPPVHIPNRGAEVWQCMCCEGIIHLVDPDSPYSTYRGGRMTDLKARRVMGLSRRAQNTRARRDLSLGRDRLPHTA